jgi:PTS system nitrogen regulatory IIA component
VSLYFLARPVDFGAADGTPVFVLCFVWSPTVRAHLSLVSQLSFALRHPAFRAVVERQGTCEEIASQLLDIEARLPHHPTPGS